MQTTCGLLVLYSCFNLIVSYVHHPESWIKCFAVPYTIVKINYKWLNFDWGLGSCFFKWNSMAQTAMHICCHSLLYKVNLGQSNYLGLILILKCFFSGYGYFHYKDKTVMRWSYLMPIMVLWHVYIEMALGSLFQNCLNTLGVIIMMCNITLYCIQYCSAWGRTRDQSVYVPSQWEMTLHCNVVSHWLGAYTKLSLRT